jgi:hypothetical protein
MRNRCDDVFGMDCEKGELIEGERMVVVEV